MPAFAHQAARCCSTSIGNSHTFGTGSRSSKWLCPSQFVSLSTRKCHRTRRACQSITVFASIPDPSEGSSQPEDLIDNDLIEKLDAKLLRWSEIPFGSVQEELQAIDDYERDEELEEGDAWPKYLRAAAYEHWDQPQLALAQYSKLQNAPGLRQVPELWERRAYNSFKVGKVGEAHAYFEVATGLYNESVGSENHFVHWFYSKFEDYVPKRNGPNPAIQKGICKYHVGLYKHARESLVPQIILKGPDMEHGILWYLASSFRLTSSGALSTSDLILVKKWMEYDFNWNPRLRLFMELYVAAGEGILDNVAAIENRLSEHIKSDDQDDIATSVYLALYNDAFTKNEEERDKALEVVSAIGSSEKPNDTENFLFCAAKNRLAAPPGSAKTTVSERTR